MRMNSEQKFTVKFKKDLKKIKVSEITAKIPDWKNLDKPITDAVVDWLVDWIKTGLADGTLQEDNVIPLKPDLAYFLGLSRGTVQQAIRRVENLGYLQPKQYTGTLIRNPESKVLMRKLTSKRDVAVTAIKRIIVEDDIQVHQPLPSIVSIKKRINANLTLTRDALEYLKAKNILSNSLKDPNLPKGWLVLTRDFIVETDRDVRLTLVEKITQELKDYITENLHVGDKIPTLDSLVANLSVSMKTLNDALKVLQAEGILMPRRGRYGAVITRMPNDNSVELPKETSIFAPAEDTVFYFYEKTKNYLKEMIAKEYQVGQKFPSILSMTKKLELSSNTVRKAYELLHEEGYIHFERGRYGGTFVKEIPEIETENFKWLAVNPHYTQVYKS